MATVSIELIEPGTKMIALVADKFVECTITGDTTVYFKNGELDDIWYETDIPDPRYSSMNQRVRHDHLFHDKAEALAFVGLDKF